MPDTPPFRRGTVSGEYNLALQQARIEALPEKLRVRLGELMLRGWIFTLVGSQLDKNDQFEDLWALSLPGSPWPALNSLLEQIKVAEGVEERAGGKI